MNDAISIGKVVQRMPWMAAICGAVFVLCVLYVGLAPVGFLLGSIVLAISIFALMLLYWRKSAHRRKSWWAIVYLVIIEQLLWGFFGDRDTHFLHSMPTRVQGLCVVFIFLAGIVLLFRRRIAFFANEESS